RRDAMGGEDGDRALGDRVLQLVDEDRAALAQRGHDVLVVDDLLADVDRRAVQLERALDRLHRPVHARAVAARSGEEQLLRSHCLKSRSICVTVSPARSSERAETALMSSQFLCQHLNVKSIRSIAGTPRLRNGVWSSITPPDTSSGKR